MVPAKIDFNDIHNLIQADEKWVFRKYSEGFFAIKIDRIANDRFFADRRL